MTGPQTTAAAGRARRARVSPPLSAREREVADLVASGETNRGIRGLLFLSETVEAHPRNVFTNLGVTSRVAVTGAGQQERAASASEPAG